MYGGMPLVLSQRGDNGKSNYLKNLFDQTYVSDIVERHSIKRLDVMDSLINILASSIGSLTNPQKIYETFKSNGEKEGGNNLPPRYAYIPNACHDG